MRIAVFLPNWIGDVVMATPAFRALRDRYSDAELVGDLPKPYVTDVVAGSPWFDRLVHLDSRGPWSRQWPAVAWNLCRPDLTVLFSNTFRTALVARLCRQSPQRSASSGMAAASC